MVIIRLQRVGRRNHAEFRVIVTEHARSAKTGGYLEVLGHYNPHTDALVVDADTVRRWIAQGAKVSPTMHNLLVTAGIVEGKKINVLPRKTPVVAEKAEKGPEEAPVAVPETTGTPAEEPAAA